MEQNKPGFAEIYRRHSILEPFSPFSTLQKLFEDIQFLDMMNMCIGSVRNDEAKLVMSGCVPAKYMSS